MRIKKKLRYVLCMLLTLCLLVSCAPNDVHESGVSGDRTDKTNPESVAESETEVGSNDPDLLSKPSLYTYVEGKKWSHWDHSPTYYRSIYAEPTVTFSHDGKEIMYSYKKTRYDTDSGFTWHLYRSEGVRRDYLEVCEQDSSFRWDFGRVFPSLSCPEEVTGWSEYRAWLDQFLEEIIDGFSADAYEFSCSEDLDSLEFSAGETGSILFWYKKVAYGVPTDEQVFLATDSAGNIKKIHCEIHGADWTSVEEVAAQLRVNDIFGEKSDPFFVVTTRGILLANNAQPKDKEGFTIYWHP